MRTDTREAAALIEPLEIHVQSFLDDLAAAGYAPAARAPKRAIVLAFIQWTRAERLAVPDLGQRILYQGVVLVCAQQDAHRRVVAFRHHVLAVPTYIGVQLADVLVAECGDFQLHQNMAFENAVIEHKVDEVVTVADENALLPRLETEAVPQLVLANGQMRPLRNV